MKKKINICKKTVFFIGVMLLFSCGRKGMPFVPDQPVLEKPYDIILKINNKKVEAFWKYKGEADFFRVELAFIKCSGCPDNFVKIGTPGGDKRFFSFTVQSEGNYKIRVIAVRKKISSKPEHKNFSVK
ncbi:MAG: hypothetical protein CSA18_02980 [Deltaproteobacteria bacterium]|nr:MAG: hypothetical protein CSA18_02980 [Deltaproteobacteria bacterium]